MTMTKKDRETIILNLKIMRADQATDPDRERAKVIKMLEEQLSGEYRYKGGK
jgi:hypothetical protein